VNYATKPIEAAYIGIGHTDLGPDIRGMNGFIPVAKLRPAPADLGV
jgi:hypothetical protein